MTVDLSDILIVVGLAIAAVGLYFVHWPLVLVLVGAVVAGVGVRRL